MFVELCYRLQAALRVLWIALPTTGMLQLGLWRCVGVGLAAAWVLGTEAATAPPGTAMAPDSVRTSGMEATNIPGGAAVIRPDTVMWCSSSSLQVASSRGSPPRQSAPQERCAGSPEGCRLQSR